MTHPLIEAVARALHDINDEISGGGTSWDRMAWESQEVERIAARAAVLATLRGLMEKTDCGDVSTHRERAVVAPRLRELRRRRLDQRGRRRSVVRGLRVRVAGV